MNSARIVEDFWAAVWKVRDAERSTASWVDDFILTTGGVDVVSRERFKELVRRFEILHDLEREVIDLLKNLH